MARKRANQSCRPSASSTLSEPRPAGRRLRSDHLAASSSSPPSRLWLSCRPVSSCNRPYRSPGTSPAPPPNKIYKTNLPLVNSSPIRSVEPEGSRYFLHEIQQALVVFYPIREARGLDDGFARDRRGIDHLFI